MVCGVAGNDSRMPILFTRTLNMSSEYIFDLGTYRRHISSSDKVCQAWFNRGLIWTYSFNHEEAASCFEKAIESDPKCAMAYWGLAYCIGPNYNKPWGFFDDKELAAVVERGHQAAKTAEANLDDVSDVERAVIKAVQHRYPTKETPCEAKACEHWNQSFAAAMEYVYKDFPNDLDVITIYVDAVMNLNPWNMWDLETGKPVDGARTIEMKSVLDNALELDDALKHPGLLHLYIHLMEMSPTPEAALPIADHLRGLVPDGGHLNHMPTHLDVLCGQYDQAIKWNSRAIEADEKYLSKAGPLNFYTLYRAHDYHFRVYAAMFAGQFKVALDTAQRLEASLPKSLLQVESPPMADWMEAFLTLRAHVLIRFGRWDDLIHLPLPDDPVLYSMTTAILHYAKGVAFAATGDVSHAKNQQQLFKQAASRVQSSRTLFNNKCSDILKIAHSMLDGELEYRLGNFDAAYEHLREAIRLEDNLPYDEPWGWMQPSRHAYGALLLEQNHPQSALEVYESDLGISNSLPRPLRHENNVWALHGAHECLLKLGRSSDANKLQSELSLALTTADIPVNSSCFCRTTV